MRLTRISLKSKKPEAAGPLAALEGVSEQRLQALLGLPKREGEAGALPRHGEETDDDAVMWRRVIDYVHGKDALAKEAKAFLDADAGLVAEVSARLVDLRAAAVRVVDQVHGLGGRLVDQLAAIAEEFAGGGEHHADPGPALGRRRAGGRPDRGRGLRGVLRGGADARQVHPRVGSAAGPRTGGPGPRG